MHGEAIIIWMAIASVCIGAMLAPVVSLIVGLVKFRGRGWGRFLLFTLLAIIPTVIVLSVAVFLLFCVPIFAFNLLTLPEALGPVSEEIPYLPGWLEQLIGGAVHAALGLMASLPFVLLVYLWTLSYGWFPAMLLKAKRHVLWLLPLLSTGTLLAFLYWVHTVDDGNIGLTWMHPVLVVVCLVAAFLAGLTITGCSRLAGLTIVGCSRLADAWLTREREPPNLHAGGDSAALD